MFEEFFVAAAVIAIAFLTYKWFELIVLKKERLMIIERLESSSLMEYAKRLPIGVKSGGVSQETKNSHMVHPVGKVLRWGLFAVGVGVGILTAFIFESEVDVNSYMREMVYGGWILLCAGVSLIISFVIEYFLSNRDE